MLDIGLLRKSVDWAEEEHARKKRLRRSFATYLNRGEHTWSQRLWGTAKLNQKTVEEGTEVYSQPHGNTMLAINPMTCGSTGCIAGHMCVIAGDRYLVPEYTTENEEISVDWVLTKEGQVRSIPDRAQELLGVNSECERGDLFSGGNTIESVRKIAQQIARDNGEEL